MKNIKKENTKTKTSEQEKNNADNIIFDILQEYEQAKKQKKICSATLKKENVIKMCDKINSHCVKLYLHNKDKRGFISLYKSGKDSDIFKYYLAPFYKACGVVFTDTAENGVQVGVFDYCNFATLSEYEKWALAKIEDNKKKQAEQKQALEKVKTGVVFNKMDKKTLQAVILQARQALATCKE